MTDSERIERLERVVAALLDALRRQGSIQDGQWGWPSFHEEVVDLLGQLPQVEA